MDFNDFGRRGVRLLGHIEPGDNMTVDHTQRVARVARRIQDKGETPVAVVGLTPKERANQTVWRTARSIAATVIVVIVPLLLSFLATGDFGRKALTTLGISVASAVLILAFQWAQKYGEARRDDQYAEQLDDSQ